jgi:hypothetical protein
MRADRHQVDVLFARRLGDRAPRDSPNEARLHMVTGCAPAGRERCHLGVAHVLQNGRCSPAGVNGGCHVEHSDEQQLRVWLCQAPCLSHSLEGFGRFVHAAKDLLEHGSSCRCLGHGPVRGVSRHRGGLGSFGAASPHGISVIAPMMDAVRQRTLSAWTKPRLSSRLLHFR